MRGVRHASAGFARWLPLGIVCLAGGVLATLGNARIESVRRPVGIWLPEAERWIEKGGEPRLDWVRDRGWEIGMYMGPDGQLFMIKTIAESAGTPELPRPIWDVPSWSRANSAPDHDPRCAAHLVETPRGWPMQSMISEIIFQLPNDPSRSDIAFALSSGALVGTVRTDMRFVDWFDWPWFTAGFMRDSRSLDQWLAVTNPHGVIPRNMFPTRIIPIGFAVNTAFYGSCICFLLTAARCVWAWLRTTIRSIRGVCPACAYPLAGLLRCPECGVVVRSK